MTKTVGMGFAFLAIFSLGGCRIIGQCVDAQECAAELDRQNSNLSEDGACADSPLLGQWKSDGEKFILDKGCFVTGTPCAFKARASEFSTPEEPSVGTQQGRFRLDVTSVSDPKDSACPSTKLAYDCKYLRQPSEEFKLFEVLQVRCAPENGAAASITGAFVGPY